MPNRLFKGFGIAVLMVMAGILVTDAFSMDQVTAEADVAVEEKLARAQELIELNDIEAAFETYLKAAALAINPVHMSEAYFGLALCAYHLQKIPEAELWIERMIEVDPDKVLAAESYPAAFVQLVRDVRGEMESPPEDPEGFSGDEPERMPGFFQRLYDQAGDFISGLEWQGKWEVEVHASAWSLNPILNMFADTLSDDAGRAVRDELRSEVRRHRPDMRPVYDEHSISVGSSGSNTGFGVRFYPRGRSGAFSLGFSLEKTVMKGFLSGPVTQVFANGSRAVVDAEAYVEMRPWSTNMSFRWDFVPSLRITPYFVLGLGLASLDGIVGYSYSGTYFWDGPDETLQDADEKDFKSTGESISDRIPNILIILQTCLGLRVNIHKGLAFRTEVGFWDGIIYRGGLSYRF